MSKADLKGETRGWEALCAILDQKTQEEVEAETGVSQSTISMVRNRVRSPGAKSMFGFEKLGIPMHWWRKPARKLRERQKREKS